MPLKRTSGPTSKGHQSFWRPGSRAHQLENAFCRTMCSHQDIGIRRQRSSGSSTAFSPGILLHRRQQLTRDNTDEDNLGMHLKLPLAVQTQVCDSKYCILRSFRVFSMTSDSRSVIYTQACGDKHALDHKNCFRLMSSKNICDAI